MNKTWMAAFFAVALMTVAGCGGGGGNSTNPINRQESPVPTSTQTTTGTFRGIDYALNAPVQAKSSELVTMKFSATNHRDTAINYDDGHGYNTRIVVRQKTLLCMIPMDGYLRATFQQQNNCLSAGVWFCLHSGTKRILEEMLFLPALTPFRCFLYPQKISCLSQQGKNWTTASLPIWCAAG